ncbi:MAG TPA: hypothetical protein VMS32_02355 [Verrucomicrobiae bacterium]|nr:hypothetical protein [Verrucomicrobiae bacterium]
MANDETTLDELKAKWVEHDHKLDTDIRLNRQLTAALTLKPARSAMGWLVFSLVVEIFFALVAVVLLGDFIGDHFRTATFSVPAIALDIFALAFLNNLIRQFVTTRQIDYSQPIATIQKKLETLRMLRIRYVQGILLIAVLAWPLLLIVGLKAFFNLDAYDLFGWSYLWANTLLGLAIIALAIWLAKRFADRVKGSPLASYLARTIGGSSLNAATDFVANLAAFEHESAI